jgi:hypothetical protein
MARKQKPLPTPPSTPFARKRPFEENETTEPLMTDRMAKAMADGTLEEFLKKELPDNEHARKLADMMMGMTGILPSEGFSRKPVPKKEACSEKPDAARHDSAIQPPEDVVNAVKSADVKGLMELLKREHTKLQGGKDESDDKEKKDAESVRDQAVIEKEVIEHFTGIASDNNLSLDWLFFRALKRYVEEYQITGNL